MEKTEILCPNCTEEYLVKTHEDDDEVYCTGCEMTFTHLGRNRVKYQEKRTIG